MMASIAEEGTHVWRRVTWCEEKQKKPLSVQVDPLLQPSGRTN